MAGELTQGRLDRDRLAKLLGLLGSRYDGEIAAAGRAAHRLIRDAGLTWPEILFEPAAAAEADPIGFCLASPERLTEWERRFLASIRRQRYPLTPKQLAVLRRLAGKCWGTP
jgi:hypothetical protein